LCANCFLTYKDVIDILELENVISKETQEHINQTVDVRKQFAHNYIQLDTKEIEPLFDHALPFYKPNCFLTSTV
jgi:uncharacterized protein YutE (UPF0331/DUF86 family)